MSGYLTMFDSISNGAFPPGGDAYAGYVDGGQGSQPNYQWITRAFPLAHHLSIALFPDMDADALDVETGAAQAADIPGWFARQVARGVQRPVIYASASRMQSEIMPVIRAIPGARPAVRLWSAHYSGAHICGPGSCGLLSTGADGTQWTSSALGRNLDQSLLLPGFFGPVTAPEPPADWVFGPVRALTLLSAGPSSVKLSWMSPGTPMPLGVGSYEVAVSEGSVLGKVYASYPRQVPKAGPGVNWQGGSLKPSTPYIAAVRAIATDGGHASPWAEVKFTTKAG